MNKKDRIIKDLLYIIKGRALLDMKHEQEISDWEMKTVKALHKYEKKFKLAHFVSGEVNE